MLCWSIQEKDCRFRNLLQWVRRCAYRHGTLRPACSIDHMKPRIFLLPDVTFASNGLDTISNAPMTKAHARSISNTAGDRIDL
jgi:hypothetical protein